MSRAELDVSRETSESLQAYCDLVQKWTRKINLISSQSISDIWNRHIVDSAQIFDLAPPTGHWVDLGSGGGFPGIVVAILSKGAGQDRRVTLVESDQRKCTFLRTAIRELELPATVVMGRIEDVEPLEAMVLSARALANLDVLFEFCERHLSPEGTALFPKGSSWQSELDDARAQWSCSCEPIRSRTNAEAAILKIKDITRV